MQAIRLSKRSHFGLLLLTRLIKTDAPVSLRNIAQSAGISKGYLEEVAAKLKAAGLILSQRGKEGGYTLGRKPSAISFADVLLAVEGETEFTPCMSSGTCFNCGGRCTTKKLIGHAQGAFTASLSKITLADIH